MIELYDGEPAVESAQAVPVTTADGSEAGGTDSFRGSFAYFAEADGNPGAPASWTGTCSRTATTNS